MKLSTLEIENLVADALDKQQKVDMYSIHLSVALTEISKTTGISEQELSAVYRKEEKEKHEG